MTRNRNNNLSKTLKDYAVAFVSLFLILILLYSVFSWTDEQVEVNSDNNYENSDLWAIEVYLEWIDALAYIVYESWKKVEIEWIISLWKSEKLSVESWSAIIDFPFLAKMKLSKNGEFTYKEDWSFYLESGNLWVESMSNIDIFMKYANSSMWIWSIANFNQNELESTIYSIDWKIDVSSLAWISTSLNFWEKVSISSKDSTSNDIDLEWLKTEIDDYFKLSSWFKENGGEELLNNDMETSSWTTLLDEEVRLEDSSSLMTFDWITDESYVNTNPIDLIWRYSPLKVWKITINNKEVTLDSDLWTFSLKWFNLVSNVNDLIIKIFDKNKNLISKNILTLYSNIDWVTNTTTTIVAKKLENYPVKATDFIIYEPTTTWKLTTAESRITIRWKVSNDNIANVVVNDYTLKSYNGSTWRYHAFVEQWTLKDWANNYEIKYLDKDSKVIYKEYYSIYKELLEDIETVLEKETDLISSEIKIN